MPIDNFSSVMLGDPVGVNLLGLSDKIPSWPDFLHLIQGSSFAEDFAMLDGV